MMMMMMMMMMEEFHIFLGDSWKMDLNIIVFTSWSALASKIDHPLPNFN